VLTVGLIDGRKRPSAQDPRADRREIVAVHALDAWHAATKRRERVSSGDLDANTRDAAKGQTVGERGIVDAGKLPYTRNRSSHEPCSTLSPGIGWFAWNRRHGERNRDDMVRLKAEVERVHIPHAPDEQTSADEENHRKPGLRKHERRPRMRSR
jgi:hypothetical protein